MFPRSLERKQLRPTLDVDIKSQLDEFNAQMERENKIREKYNGEIVMELTGLKGKELGSFMNKFKEFVPLDKNPTAEAAIDYLLHQNHCDSINRPQTEWTLLSHKLKPKPV